MEVSGIGSSGPSISSLTITATDKIRPLNTVVRAEEVALIVEKSHRESGAPIPMECCGDWMDWNQPQVRLRYSTPMVDQ